MDALSLRYDPDNLDGSSLNYVDEVRQRIWPLFLCASVVGSVNRGSPLRHKRYARSQTLFAIFVSFVVYTRRRSVWSDYRLRILTTKRTKITKESQRLIQFLITRKTFCAGFVPFVSFVVYTRRRSV